MKFFRFEKCLSCMKKIMPWDETGVLHVRSGNQILRYHLHAKCYDEVAEGVKEVNPQEFEEYISGKQEKPI